MLLEANRLTKKRDFEKVFLKGLFCQGRALTLRFFINNLNQSRFGLVVGIKVSKKAVVRNRLRRQLGETIRKNLAKIKPGFDVVLIAKKQIADKSSGEIKEEVGSLLKKANLCD